MHPHSTDTVDKKSSIQKLDADADISLGEKSQQGYDNNDKSGGCTKWFGGKRRSKSPEKGSQ